MDILDEQLLREMTGQSSEMWMQAEDRIRSHAMPVIICRNPERAYYLQRVENFTDSPPNVNGWVIEECSLKIADAADFFAAFGTHWPYWLGAVVRDAPLRAYIKNGRKEGWSISLDVKTVDPIESLTLSLRTFQKNIQQATEG